MTYELRTSDVGSYSGISSDYGFGGRDSYVSSGVESRVGEWDSNPFEVFGEKKVAKSGKDFKKDRKVRKMRVLPRDKPDKNKGDRPSGSPMRAP